MLNGLNLITVLKRYLTELMVSNKIGFSTSDDQHKGWVQSNVGEATEVVKRVLLRPSPHTNRQDAQTCQLQQYTENSK